MPAPETSRRSFTLVELLVVIAIIGILISLLLPAVQSAREAARLTECKNHLKQLALGILNHEQAHRMLPTGGWAFSWSGDPDRGFDHRQPGGWIYNTLPYLEQQALHDMGTGMSGAAKNAQLTEMQRTPIAVLFCPSRREAKNYPNYPTYSTFNYTNVAKGTRTDYASNCGDYFDDLWSEAPVGPNDDPAAGYASLDWPAIHAGLARYTGVLPPFSNLQAAHLHDGASSTYLVAEKYLAPNDYEGYAEAADNQPIYVGYDWDMSRWTTYPPRRDRLGSWDHYAFGSAHVAGFQAAMCDGSVHVIGWEIDPAVHRNLGNRKDGQVAAVP